MLYNVTNKFTKIAETTGTIQNAGSIHAVEVSDKAESSGILLFPTDKFSFTDKTLYVRCPSGRSIVRVAPFEINSGSSSGSSEIPDEQIATDEQIDDMLDDIFN